MTPPEGPICDEFFMLESYAPDNGECADILEYPLIEGIDSWLLGTRFDVPIPEPIRLAWDSQSPGPRKMLYDVTIPLYHRELLAALRQAGIDNLDAYATEITDPESGTVTSDYLAVNIIGVVAAADLTRSTYSDPGGRGLIDVDFDSLALDAERTLGARMFRLAECITGVVIHRSVKDYLEARGGFGLTFVPPGQWVG